MSTKKEESYEPLFESGITDLRIEECYQLLVNTFNKNVQRENLMERFLVYYWELCQLGIYIEMWLDGSFVTKKENPSDVDIVLILDREQVKSLGREQSNQLMTLTYPPTAEARYGVDVRVHGFSEAKRLKQKFEWFSHDKNLLPKGFARLIINPCEKEKPASGEVQI